MAIDEGEDVYCTLVMTDSYLPGAAVLAKSLRDGGTQKKLACMVVQENLRPSTITALQSLYDHVIPVPQITTPNPLPLYTIDRPDLHATFTKLNLWRLTQFRRIIYTDADMLCLRAPDELFALTDPFAAAPDVGFPDIFNSGFFVTAPDAGVYAALRAMAATGDSFDGADQGLLNQYFEHKGWKRLSFTYNCTPSAGYQYEPAYRYFKRGISMLHFIGREKPWMRARKEGSVSGNGGEGVVFRELVGRWWGVYERHFGGTLRALSIQEEQTLRAIRGQVTGEDSIYSNGGLDSTISPAASMQAEAALTRIFSPPQSQWDATRAPPPLTSKPEAPDFPNTHYQFNTDSTPYRAPTSFPAPPREVSNTIPTQSARSAGALAPIFPWEEREHRPATRKFIEDEIVSPPIPPPKLQVIDTTTDEDDDGEDDFRGADELEVEDEDDDLEEASARGLESNPSALSAISASTRAAARPFEGRGYNAWDDVIGIDDYVRALTASQKHRRNISGSSIVGSSAPATAGDTQDKSSTQLPQQALSPTEGFPPSDAGSLKASTQVVPPPDLVEKVRQRRESLILTDFPSAIERPSLPVTPAPIRRATFWGGEEESFASGSGGGAAGGVGGEGEGMPAAEGVPRQEDWDPSAQLEQLRRNSLLSLSEIQSKTAILGLGGEEEERRRIPDRVMPGTNRSGGKESET